MGLGTKILGGYGKGQVSVTQVVKHGLGLILTILRFPRTFRYVNTHQSQGLPVLKEPFDCNHLLFRGGGDVDNGVIYFLHVIPWKDFLN